MAADERAVELELEPFAPAEEVAMLQADIAARPFVGAIAGADAIERCVARAARP